MLKAFSWPSDSFSFVLINVVWALPYIRGFIYVHYSGWINKIKLRKCIHNKSVITTGKSFSRSGAEKKFYRSLIRWKIAPVAEILFHRKALQ